MEGFFFLAEIVLMLLLALAIFRAERREPPGDLGLFAYKKESERGDRNGEGKPRA